MINVGVERREYYIENTKERAIPDYDGVCKEINDKKEKIVMNERVDG